MCLKTVNIQDGYCTLQIYPEESLAVVIKFWIQPHARGKGRGVILWKETKAACMALQLKTIELIVDNNETAIAFWKKQSDVNLTLSQYNMLCGRVSLGEQKWVKNLLQSCWMKLKFTGYVR